MKCRGGCSKCSTLERNLSIDKLNIGDCVGLEGKYITSAGYYFSMGTGFRVKRINCKSITLAPLENVDGKWREQKTIRIARWVKECSNYSSAKMVKPLFARDNTRFENG